MRPHNAHPVHGRLHTCDQTDSSTTGRGDRPYLVKIEHPHLPLIMAQPTEHRRRKLLNQCGQEDHHPPRTGHITTRTRTSRRPDLPRGRISLLTALVLLASGGMNLKPVQITTRREAHRIMAIRRRKEDHAAARNERSNHLHNLDRHRSLGRLRLNQH